MTIVMNASRCALLQDVADQEVWFDGRRVVNTRTGLDVLGEVVALRRAGLVDVDFGAERVGSWPYVLTETGTEILAAKRKATNDE